MTCPTGAKGRVNNDQRLQANPWILFVLKGSAEEFQQWLLPPEAAFQLRNKGFYERFTR
jgi:hypothetical protein